MTSQRDPATTGEEVWRSWVDNFRNSPRETQEAQWAELTGEQISFLEGRFRLFGPRGTYRGKYCRDWKEDIEALKRAGKSEEAIRTMAELLEAADPDDRSGGEYGPLPVWYYEQLAILYRKAKRYEEEIAYLEGLLNGGTGRDRLIRRMILNRIGKAYRLAGRIERRRTADGQSGDFLPDGRHLWDLPIFWRTLSVVDVETTGFSRRDELIELAIVSIKVNERTSRIERISQYSGLREPSVPIDARAGGVHGLTMKDLVGSQLDVTRIERLLTGSDFLIAHNAGFDRRFVEAAVPGVSGLQWLCSMNGIDWLSKGFPDRKLAQLLTAHGIFPDSRHRALSDAMGLVDLLEAKDGNSGQPYIGELLASRTLPPRRSRQEPQWRPQRIRIGLDAAERTLRPRGTGCALTVAAVLIPAGVWCITRL